MTLLSQSVHYKSFCSDFQWMQCRLVSPPCLCKVSQIISKFKFTTKRTSLAQDYNSLLFYLSCFTAHAYFEQLTSSCMQVGKQCDQMVRLVFHYLAIYNNENLPISYKLCQSGFKTLPSTKLTLKILPRIIHFCQSGEISPNLTTLFVNIHSLIHL